MATLADRLRIAMEHAGITQAELARACGVKPPSVHGWLSGKAKFLRGENLLRASAALGVNQLWLATGQGPMRSGDQTPGSLEKGPGREIELIDNPDFPAIRRAHVRASAGITGFAIDYDAGDGDTAPIVFRRDWFEKHGYRPDRMIAMRVNGESMEPTLYDGDLIVVNMDSTTPKDGVAYLVLYEGEPVVKRLVRDAGAWWLASDNPDQRRYARKLCDDATRIVGEVVYRQSERV